MKKSKLVFVKGVTRAEMAHALMTIDEEVKNELRACIEKGDYKECQEKILSREEFANRLIEIQYEMLDRKHYYEMKNNIFEKCLEGPFLEQIKECFSAFEDDAYYLCMCGLLPLLERLIVEDITSPEYNWTKLEEDFKKRFKPYFKSKLEKDLEEHNIRFMFRDLTEWVGFDEIEPICLNRHWLLHGRANRMPTKVDCFKILNIFELILDIKNKMKVSIK